MKARTPVGSGMGQCYVSFAWESSDYGGYHGSYQSALKERHEDGFKGGPTLIGVLFNDYFNSTELIDEKVFDMVPTVSEVKTFIAGCYQILQS